MKAVMKVLNRIWVGFGVFLLLDAIAGALTHGPKKYFKALKDQFMHGWNSRI